MSIQTTGKYVCFSANVGSVSGSPHPSRKSRSPPRIDSPANVER